ncbi:MAG: Holliday junction branch migration protein RuvA, partial [bacterium]
QPVKLLTFLHVREDEHTLFGFLTTEERDLFKLLVAHVSGVGPKLALMILSGCAPEQLRSAVAQGDAAFLARMKGVGKKTAERVIVELRDKVGIASTWAATASASLSPEQQKQNDALLALLALGYKQPDALKALKNANPKASVEEMVRDALKGI